MAIKRPSSLGFFSMEAISAQASFTATEADADLDPVAVLQELLSSLDFGIQVVGVNAGAHADFLDFHHPLIFLGFLFPLLLVKAEFGIVHDFAHRGDGVGGNLYKVEALLLCHGIGLSGRNNAQLSAIGTDKPDFLVTNLLIELMF